MVKLGANLRVRFQYLVQKIAKEGKVPLTLVRGGKEMSLQLPVSPNFPMLIANLQGTYPSYFILGPLVFSGATTQFLGGLGGGNNNPLGALSFSGSPLATRRGDPPAFEGEELVVVSSPFFPHKLSKGYSNPAGNVVGKVNGKAVKHLRHLVEMLRDSREEFLVFEFAGRGDEAIVFPRKDMLAATDEILTDNGIRAQGSPDVLAVWTAKPAQ
jgi:hypothetical protein